MFPQPVDSLTPYSHPQVTGLTLTVTAGEDISRVLRFDNSETPVINIGRMPSSRVNELELDLDPDLAWFRCAVVSRKHAKICFADSGHVYLIDLSSHHGTHLLKVGHAVPVALAPEVPTPLADGDVVTFGKSVGKDADLVRPVSVRVKFLLQPADHSEISQPTHIQRSSSGRFGVLTDIDSSSSSSDSEVEEVDPPEVIPSNPYRAQIPSHSLSHGFGFIEQWFRTDASSPHTQSQPQSRLSLPSFHSQSQPQSKHEVASSSTSSMAKEVINVDDYDDSELVIPYRTTQAFTHLTDMSIPPSSAAAIVTPIPIDLEDTIDSIVVEPSLVGAWPPSPRSPIDHEEFVVSLMDNMGGGEVDMNLESDAEDSPGHDILKISQNSNPNPSTNPTGEVADVPHTPQLGPIDAVDLGPSANAVAEPDTTTTTLKVLGDIKEDLDSIKENVRQVSSDVWELQKSQQNTSTSVWDINRRVDSLDLRIKAMESTHETNYEKLSAMLEKEAARVDEVLRECQEEKEETKKTCKTLMDEIQSLREQTEKQVSTEVEALKIVQKETLDAVRAMTQETQITCTNHLNNLKRKRDELEEEEAERAIKLAKFSRGQVAGNAFKAASIFTAGVIATWSALAFA
ncbi:hypothetical protein BDM02DRAFT_3112211 [Thelephora ganbajun]|uniref:Uncharacterized protein n=1 Tax=Thelephora ganbajun TaxID=370292 RepID=A0ACB6ZM81_THEGA|nr:hypothetical protein BDM02DRAFT_3112211 [Thelephora ganbajun]